MCDNHDSETVFFDNQLEFKENKATYVIEAHYDDKMEDLVTKIKNCLNMNSINRLIFTNNLFIITPERALVWCKP